MFKIFDVGTHVAREPWLAASFSWLLPGVGHIYVGAYDCGTFLVALACFLYVLRIFSILYTGTWIILPMLLALFSRIVLPVYASIFAFRAAKKRNADDFEKERTLSKDPWLVVFLSMLLPGAGHAYLRRIGLFILYILGFFALLVMSLRVFYWFPAYAVFRLVVCVHGYALCRIYRTGPKRLLVLFSLVFVCTYSLRDFLVPRVVDRFFMEVHGPLLGSSMEPTVPEHSRSIVDKFTYRWKNPEVGDIILFSVPNHSESDAKMPACKRVIAVEGEAVQIRDSVIYVNGKERDPVRRRHQQEYPDSSLPIDFYGPDYLTYGVEEPYQVPQGCYFVIGDNREYSVDSRCYGAIPRENIIGRVITILWPPRRTL